MTTEQIHEHYDIVFQGRQYLCVPGANHPLRPAPPLPRPAMVNGPRAAKRAYILGRRAEVIQALPGTVVDIMARTGICRDSVNTVLAKLKQERRIVATVVRHYPLTHAYAWAETVIG